MISSFKKGFMQAIAFLLVFSGVAFAFQVSGTIKTWTTGETLTASDLNTTVQSLKTAVEGATQVVQMEGPGSSGIEIYQYYYKALAGGPNFDETIISPPMLRSGTVKNVRMLLTKTSNNDRACRMVLLKNGSETDIDFTIPANTPARTVFTDPDTVSFVQGDSMVWRIGCDLYMGYYVYPSWKHLLSFEF